MSGATQFNAGDGGRRTANLQAVMDDPAISTTQQMSAGTSAAVTVLTDVDWADLHA